MEQLKNARKVRTKKKGLKTKTAYSYECPVTLCQSIEGGEIVSLNLYIIEIQSNSFLALLTTLPISDIPDFKLFLANKGGDWKNNERLYKIYIEMRELQRHSYIESTGDTASEIFNELFSEETVRVVSEGKREFTKKEINLFFKFYIRLFSDIYQVPTEKIATTFFSFTEKPDETEKINRRTYLILPATAEHTIDETIIFNYLDYKRKLPEMGSGESVADFINQLKSNTAVMMDALNTSILESFYGNNAKYYAVDLIVEPQTQKAKDLLYLIGRYFTKKTYEEMLEAFGITAEQAEEMTVDFLLYEHKIEKVDFIHSFRKIDQKYNIETDRSAPVLFVQPPLTPITFDFINITKILTNYPSCRKHKVVTVSLSNFPLVSAHHLKRHPFSVPQIDLYMKVPSIMTRVERYVLVNEFRGSKQIVSHTEDLFIATCTSSYDTQKNNEVMETIGDSVLKLITSMYLYVKSPLSNESDLTEKRIQYITNEVLMHLGFQCRVPYFLKISRKNANEWRPPYMKHEEKVVKHEMTGKQVADCVEAIIGASFLFKYELYYPTLLLKQLGLPVYGMIINTHLIKNSSLIIPDQYLPEPSETFSEDITYFQLNQYFWENKQPLREYGCGKAYAKIKQMKTKLNWSEARYANILINSVLARFERKILGYRFKNKAYLLHALNSQVDKESPLFYQNYESLEFLGDSIVEIYVLANAYKIFKAAGRDIKPEVLQSLKISLLSNAFMARIAVMNEFHRYLITSSQEVIEEVDTFVQKVSFNKKYRSFVKHEFQVPKILSDIYEAIAAAVLYDGGWKAIHQVFGRLLGPYIKFFCLYYQKMETNIVEKLKQKALAQ